MLSIALALSLACGLHGTEPSSTLEPSPRPWTVQPGSARGPGTTLSGADALWRAIERAAPGAVIDVAAGEYPWGVLGQNGAGPRGTQAQPIVVRAQGPVVVRPQDWGGGATLTIHRGSYVTFEGFKFEASGSGIFFMPAFPSAQRGWHFIDCEIDGMYDWRADRSRHPSGVKCKWGISSWGLADFLWEGGSIHDTYWEHAMYHRNPRGDIVVRAATLERLGRTAIQVRCPEDEAGQSELPAGRGRFTVEHCTIRDTGLVDGGSALTLAGRNTLNVNLISNRIEFGFDASLRRAWQARRPNQRFGAGAIVIWSERPGWNNGPLRILDNTIRYAPSCGDRSPVQIGSAPRLVFQRNRVQVADNSDMSAEALAASNPRREPWRDAVQLNPRDPERPGDPRTGFADIAELSLSQNEVEGRFLVSGQARR